jgi:hypothetical protein
MGFLRGGTHVIIVPPSDFFQPLASSETILSLSFDAKKLFSTFYFKQYSQWALKQIYIVLP